MDMTVIIPCKNRDTNVQFCLGAITTCNPSVNVLLVDFGSKKPLNYLSDKYANVTVINVKTNNGFFHKSRALNIGIRFVTTKFVCAIDADQIMQANFFNVVYETLTSNKKALVSCKTYGLKKIPNNSSPDTVRKDYNNLYLLAKSLGNRHGDGCCTAIKTSWVKKVHGWDESYVGWGAQDSDFAMRAHFSGFIRIWIQNKTSMVHLPHFKRSRYYDPNKYFKPNRQRFLIRRRNVRKNRKLVVVNRKINWGKI